MSLQSASSAQPMALAPSAPDAAPAPSLASAGFTAGRLVAGKYRIERWIGEGAMGVVVAATHLGLDETVAIKFIKPDFRHTPEMLARFAKEAKIAARIRSDHVTRVLDVGVVEPLGPYIVMEYLEGRSLSDVLESDGPLPVRRAVAYLLQACEALAAAHSLGVIHRDIKPGNLFITRHGNLENLKLLDFGISKAALSGRVFGSDLALTETRQVIGTPVYMSPEQIRTSSAVDPRTDIWSVGTVLYELVTGETAFTADSISGICAQILDGSPAQLDLSDAPGVDDRLREVINRCLCKDPNDRYQTVADLAMALMPLAPPSARLHADRSSCILRASSLDLDPQLTEDEPSIAALPPDVPAAAPGNGLWTFAAAARAAVVAALLLALIGVWFIGATQGDSAPVSVPVNPLGVSAAVSAPAAASVARAPGPEASGNAALPWTPLRPAAIEKAAIENTASLAATRTPRSSGLRPPARASSPPARGASVTSSPPPGSSNGHVVVERHTNRLAVSNGDVAPDRLRLRLVDERPRLRLVGEP